jgi:beta-galactosidase beta subunit
MHVEMAGCAESTGGNFSEHLQYRELQIWLSGQEILTLEAATSWKLMRPYSLQPS